MPKITMPHRISEALVNARQELNLSASAAHVGQYAEAVVHAKAAVVILRGFEPPSDEKKAYLELFTEASHTLVQRLFSAGRVGEAAEHIEEAVRLYQQLAAVSGVNVTQVAAYLLTLSVNVSTVLLHTEAVKPAQAAVEILRGFVPATDAQTAYFKLFAEALYTLALRLQAARRVLEAKSPADEAIQVLRRLVELDPEQFGPFLQKVEQLQATLSGYFCALSYDSGSSGSRTSGAPGTGYWKRGALKVSIDTAGCTFYDGGTSLTAIAVIAHAFRLWEAASTFFTFIDAPASSADIRVVFGGQNLHPDFGHHEGFAGIGYYPETSEQGNLWFDSAEDWSADGSISRTVSLLHVALHEIGHVLGLSHSDDPDSLMNADANTINPIHYVDSESRETLRLMYDWTPQQRLSDRGTSDRAVLEYTSSSNFTSLIRIPRMVWKGIPDDSGIYESEFISGQWTPQRRIPTFLSSHSPALIQIDIPGPTPRTGLIMAWKGHDNTRLYWSRDLGNGWHSQREIPGVASTTRPALASVAGRIYMAWKGSEDRNIWWSEFNGVDDWSPQAQIGEPGLLFGTSDSPAIVGVGNKMFMFWKGIPGDSTAWWSVIDFDDPNPHWRDQERIKYFRYEYDRKVTYTIGTSGGLSATRRGDNILIAWKGAGDDTGIYVSLFDTFKQEFGGQIKVSNYGTSVGPSVMQLGDTTMMAWKGVDDRNIWWSQV